MQTSKKEVMEARLNMLRKQYHATVSRLAEITEELFDQKNDKFNMKKIKKQLKGNAEYQYLSDREHGMVAESKKLRNKLGKKDSIQLLS